MSPPSFGAGAKNLIHLAVFLVCPVIVNASTACPDICHGARTNGRRVVNAYESFFFVRVFQKLEVDAFDAEFAFLKPLNAVLTRWTVCSFLGKVAPRWRRF